MYCHFSTSPGRISWVPLGIFTAILTPPLCNKRYVSLDIAFLEVHLP
ncbi:hypothetical protein AB3M96_03155 [Fredinandcohnia sp. 179-A 10B2 NHS]